MNNLPAIVYSYIRFSTPEQAKGSSGDRQADYARRYADERGFVLDETLTMRDEGLSAYHEHHITRGALGVFLRAVEDGRVQAGSILVIEGLDRLSRAEPIVAQGLLSQIIGAGITVVTASDGREYNRDSLRANPMDLVYSLLVMIRAHEESATKSTRVTAAIVRLCEQWQSGSYRGVIRQGHDPSWVKKVSTDPVCFELIPERVAAVRKVLELYVSGHGGKSIVDALNKDGLTITGRAPQAAYIYRLVRNPMLLGTKVIRAGGTTFELEGYYPGVYTPDEWAVLQSRANKRAKIKGQNEIPGLITGIGRAYCGYCGDAMCGINNMSRARADGTLADGHRRLICTSANKEQSCTVGGSVTVVPVEKALLSYCSDVMNIAGLLGGTQDDSGLKNEQLNAEAEHAELHRKVEKLTDALLEFDESPRAVLERIREYEARQVALKKRIENIRHELVALSNRRRPGLVEEWEAVKVGVNGLDYDARIRVRQLVSQTFERIDVYIKGAHAAGSDDSIHARVARELFASAAEFDGRAPIDVVLRFSGGITRLLRINRKTGEWLAMVDFETAG